VNFKAGLSRLWIIKGVCHLIYNQWYRHEGRTWMKYYLQYNLFTDTTCPSRPEGSALIVFLGNLYCLCIEVTKDTSPLKSKVVHWSFSSKLQICLSLSIKGDSWYLHWCDSLIRKIARQYFAVWGKSIACLITCWVWGYFCSDTLELGLPFLLRWNYFATAYRQIDTWSSHTGGQSVLGYKCWRLGDTLESSLGQYS